MGKTILITGASSGIGAATAAFLAEGNELFIHYGSSQQAAEATAAVVRQHGGVAHLVQADLSAGESACRALHRAVAARTDKLDVLVNNAGSFIRWQPFRELDWKLMETVFHLNALSPMLLTSLLLPLLDRGQDPCIVNITSIAVRPGAAGQVYYSAAKGAMDVFTRGIAQELAPKIRVNAVAPGFIMTPLHERLTPPEFMQEWIEKTPLRKAGNGTHIAQAVKMLIENDFMTGETIDVNGGLYVR